MINLFFYFINGSGLGRRYQPNKITFNFFGYIKRLSDFYVRYNTQNFFSILEDDGDDWFGFRLILVAQLLFN